MFDALSGDFHPLGLDISSSGKYPAADFFGWDDLDKLPSVDAIIHLAGKAHDTANTSLEEEYFVVNLGLTQKIFDWFLQSGAEKFIFFSSVKAVADSVKGEWLTEEAEPDPGTSYGRSKLAAEQYILSKQQQDAAGSNPQTTVLKQSAIFHPKSYIRNPKLTIRNPKSIYILRPAMIHGPGNKGNLNLLYKLVQKGIPWPLGAFENQRTFSSMDNVAFVVRQLLGIMVPPGIYNMADDEPVSTNGIIRLMAESLGRKPGIWHLPEGMVRLAARTGDFLHLPLNSERLKKLTETFLVSNRKIKSALGIVKLPVTSRDGLVRTFRSFSDRKG
jgi:nucleoside-diphosphate-sugar epimerase